ncbi:MAG: hypothetical protein RMK30_04590 [Anaerolineae bacterium]|nr:hypothetical protein [Anaerolineae bacterium]MDW8102140.1 hypothetical protein [Anaerolineae bacterium]
MRRAQRTRFPRSIKVVVRDRGFLWSTIGRDGRLGVLGSAMRSAVTKAGKGEGGVYTVQRIRSQKKKELKGCFLGFQNLPARCVMV